jgi:hypothetical protein
MTYAQLPVYTAEQVDAMSARERKSYETRCRRAADRQGLKLQKSPRRDPRAYDYGTYQLTDIDTGTLAVWGLQSGYGLGLDDVARALNEDDDK